MTSKSFSLSYLTGNVITLEPINLAHENQLRIAVNDERIWTYMPINAAQHFDMWFDDCLQKMNDGSQLTYAIRYKQDNTIIGSTSYYDIQEQHKRLTLGYSWYKPNFWRTKVNPECKLLILKQAFENWDMQRIEIGTDARNTHSYHAIKKLGAKQEGILRNHMILHDGAITDTILFSIIASEWQEVKEKLQSRLQADS